MLKRYARNIVRSFYDASLYKEAINEWQGVGAKHMLAVSVVVGLLVTVMLAVSLYAFNKYELPYVLEQMPRIDVKDNVISVQGPDPVVINSKDEKFRIIIDTKADELELYKKDAQIIVGKSIILVKQVEGFKPFPLENVKRYTLTREGLRDFFNKIYAFLIFAWPVMTLGQLVTLAIQAALVAILSYAVTAPMREEYYFGTRMRIAALAVTPPFLVSKVTALFMDSHAEGPITSMWFALLLALLYFYVMIILIRRIDEPAKV